MEPSVGGKYWFRLDCNKAIVITADSLHGLYVTAASLKRTVIGIVFNWLDDARDDQAITHDIKEGSLVVKLQCFTDERFMQVWGNYKSGELKKRLQEEFSACEIEVEGLKIDIENLEEVKKIKVQIENRMDVTETPAARSPGIIVTGGAYGSVMNARRKECLRGIKQAAREGYDLLMQEGKTAVDAVEEAVRILENDKYFNAGTGSFVNKNGEVECDAMIMDGNTMETGAVMAVQHFTNPVLLSRKVMEETSHCALCANGALNFAKNIQFPTCNPEELVQQTSLHLIIPNEDQEDFVAAYYPGKPVPPRPGEGDSVSAVAIDANGHLACATSTGGIPNKPAGRIGDAPLIGCGGYANKSGAATSSGLREALMKMTLARDVVFNMEKGLDAQKSAEKSVQRLQDEVQGPAGIIAIDKNGNFGKAFNTDVMIWATVKDGELKYGMDRDECLTESIK